jgi:hypothetical protein
MPTPIEQIRDLKTGAKNQRDRGIEKGYPQALLKLYEAITIARRELAGDAVAETRKTLAAELSDCFGLIGGVERRWADETTDGERVEHLQKSIRAYDDGYAYESDEQYGIVNSYNLVNRLVVRILLWPDALAGDSPALSDPEIESLHLPTELDHAAAFIRQQLAGPRRGDFWALADLALLEVLEGRRPAAAAYADFIALSPPDFAYKSALAALRPLAGLPIPTAQALGDAVVLLEERLQQLRS